MFHAVLTSSSFSHDTVYSFVKDIVTSKGYAVCSMVTTAHPQKESAPWVQQTVNDFDAMSVSVEFVDFEKGENVGETADIVYVCGGNTPRLLKAAREVGAKQSFQSLADRDGLYIGSSAGSVLLSPTIDSALEIHPSDENEVGLVDFTGLEFVPFHMIVHYEDSMKDQADAFMLRHKGEEVFLVRNGEAVVVEGDMYYKI